MSTEEDELVNKKSASSFDVDDSVRSDDPELFDKDLDTPRMFQGDTPSCKQGIDNTNSITIYVSHKFGSTDYALVVRAWLQQIKINDRVQA